MNPDSLRQDLLFALRGIRRNTGYALVVTLTLAVGIATATSVFSVVVPYLIRPLPYDHGDRLVQLEQMDPETGADWIRFSLPQWSDWRERSQAFDDIAAYRYTSVNLTGGGGAERVMAAFVTGNLFDVLGVEAERGRALRAGEWADDHVVVLSHGLWVRRYGADPGTVGSGIRIDGEPHTVVGIAPPDFNFPWNEVRMWIPESSPVVAARDHQNLILVGRLAEGSTREAARAELLAIQARLGETFPGVDGRYDGVNMRPLREALNFLYEVVRLGLGLLLAAVLTLLLIACVNVASLTLARTSARRREVAVRQALGAGRGRLARQLVAESVALAVLGGIGGLLAAWTVIDVLGAALPDNLYRVGTATLDLRVFLFALTLTAATPILFGLAPALGAARTAPGAVLRSGGRAGAGRRATRGRRALVVGQVALAVALVAVTGLLARSFAAVRAVDPGVATRGVSIVEVSPPAGAYADRRAVDDFYDRASAALASLPGISGVGAASAVPLNHETHTVAFRRPGDGAAAERQAVTSAVSPGYFGAMGTPLLEGRDFRSDDDGDADPVVVVSRRVAAELWPGESAVGRSVRLGPDGQTVATVVGVAGDVHWTELTSRPAPHIYRPLAQRSVRRGFLVVRGAGDRGADPAAIRRAFATVDPELPVTIRGFREILRENDFQWSVASLSLGAFGLLALLLAALGIYGLLAYAVSRRYREIGIRQALGATARDIRVVVVGEGLRLTFAGLVLGIVLALAAARLLGSMLFGVRPLDPVTLGAAALLFTAVAVAASAVPALRAARIGPDTALREE